MSTLNNISFYEKPEYNWEENEQHMIFTGNIDGKSRQYLILNRDYINDGRRAEGRLIWFSVKWVGNAGSIYKVKITPNENGGDTINYVIKNIPIGFWKNQEQRVEWQSLQRAKEDSVAFLNKSREDNIEFYLRPLAIQYDKLRSRQERTVMLARVIDYITSSRI